MNAKLQAKARIPTRSGSPAISNNLFRHRAVRQIEAGETHHRSQLRDSNFNHDFSRVPITANSQAAAVAPLFSPCLPGPIQAKLVVNEPGDEYEREADRVADAVMRMNEPMAVSNGIRSIQGNCPTCEEEKMKEKLIEGGKLLQTKGISGQNAETTYDIESRINAIRGGGMPLSESERAFFEPRFSHDFGQVRLHTDALAAEAARALNARAFTVGRDVVFGSGHYSPGTSKGQKLMAHELTHVIQQGRGTAGIPDRANKTVQRENDGEEGGTFRNIRRLTYGLVVRVEVRAGGDIENITHEYPIDVNGYIKIPPLGLVRAAGLSTDQLADQIQGDLTTGGFIRSPTVNVTLTQKIVAYGALITYPSVYLRLLGPDGTVESGSGEYPVRSDGTLNLPYVGIISARNRRLDVVESEIESLIRQGYIHNGFVHLTRQHLD